MDAKGDGEGKEVGLSVYQPKRYRKGVCKETAAKTGLWRKKHRNKFYMPPTCHSRIKHLHKTDTPWDI